MLSNVGDIAVECRGYQINISIRFDNISWGGGGGGGGGGGVLPVRPL